MAHGTPDWGVTAGLETVYQMTDLGELAARLGSPITHDRRGDVVWWDDFEWSLNKWNDQWDGTGGGAAISTARARNGRCSALLTSGSDAGHFAGIQHFNPFPAPSMLGAECSFSLGGEVGAVRWQVNTYNGVEVVAYEVRILPATEVLQYLDSAGSYQDIATGVHLLADATLFHTVKLVVDAASGEYVRVVLNEETYPLAAIAAQGTPSSAAPAIILTARYEGRAGSNDLCYVDDAILTQNEPA